MCWPRHDLPLCRVCDQCAPGTFQNLTGASACTQCTEGTYNNYTASTSAAACREAPKGTYAPGPGNDGFTYCDAGTYQDETGKGACKVGGSRELWRQWYDMECFHGFACM